MSLVAAGPQAGPQELRDRPVQLRGSRLARALLRAGGWRLDFDGLAAKQGVIVVYPHTSNWDFIVGLLAKWAMGLPVAFWGKDSLFRIPLLGRWMRWLGGVPVDRRSPQGTVDTMVAQMRDARADGRLCWLALSPEGTRSLTAGWRSGFYRVALQADVPVALVRLDYGRRRVGFDSFWRLSGDLAADFALFEQRLSDSRGLRAELAAPIRPLPSPSPSPERRSTDRPEPRR